MFRQKKYICGNFLDVEIFQAPPKTRRIKRAIRVKESTPAQRNLNDKNSKKHFVRLVHKNFDEKDLYVDLTYDKENIPQEREEVLRDIRNYISRIKRWRKKQGMDPMKYIYVISNMDQQGRKVRYHVHMIMSGMDRDVAEKKWGKGYANTDRLRFDEHGVTGKSLYMARQAKGTRSWGSSTNLKRVEAVVSDNAITRSVMERMINSPDDKAFFEKKYPGWIFTDCKINLNENEEGWGIGIGVTIRMRRYEDHKARKERR